MSKEAKFLVFCMEEYRNKKNLTGKELTALFSKYGVYDYVLSSYESLHTTGTNYIIEDIDEFLKVRQAI